MASASQFKDYVLVECGYCLEKGSAMKHPRLLDCSHTHCLPCLVSYRDINGVIKCPLQACGEVYDVIPSTLPSAEQVKVDVEDETLICDSCTEGGGQNMAAVIYCDSCSTNFCNEHKQHHDAIFPSHMKINVNENEYRVRKRKLKSINCSTHGLPITVGCKNCQVVACLRCMSVIQACKDGADHGMISLDDLIVLLTKKLRELKVELMDKEDKVQELFKTLSELVCDYKMDTEKMIERIHKQRDEQIKAIEKKYEEMEAQLIELREASLTAMTRFMEEDVGLALSELNKSCMKIEAGIQNSHQVDLANGFEETRNTIQTLLERDIPELELKGMGRLEQRGDDKCRDTEVKLVLYRAVIGWKDGLMEHPDVPKTLNFLRSVNIHQNPRSSANHQGATYVGVDDGIVWKIDAQNQLSDIHEEGRSIESLAVYDDTLLSLHKIEIDDDVFNYEVNSYKLLELDEAEFQTRWLVDRCTQICVVAGEVILLQNKQLGVYSMTGQLIRNLPCPEITANIASSLCAAGIDSVVVSIQGKSKIYKISTISGEVMWTSAEITYPMNVTIYGNKWLLVTTGQGKLCVLDINSGDFVSEMTVGGVTSEQISEGYCLDLYNKTLAISVSKYPNDQMRYYQIN